MKLNRVNLITEMAKQKTTCEKLSKDSGVSKVVISRIRSGNSCREATAEKIARALNVPLEQLI